MILASFPIYNEPEITKHAIASLGDVDKFFVINTPELEYLVKGYDYVVNKVNNYCNGGWNQAMRVFLAGDWEYLALGSSDVILSKDWHKKIPNTKNEVWVPTYSPDLEKMKNWRGTIKELIGGVAGVFTVLPREAVKIVYPIPRELKLWFGDEYMYGKLRATGWHVCQSEFTAFHYGSLSIFSNPKSNSIIESDKLAWEKFKENNGKY